MTAKGVLLGLVISGWSVSGPANGGPMVNESARDIPVAYNVDVVVVGGSTGAVSAALAAAEQGATVFLAAPRPYLGDDMTATLRLWLEPGENPEHPLAQRVFNDPMAPRIVRNRLEFSYETDLPSIHPHHDTDPPSQLTNGQWGSAVGQSVQYNGDVTITADLGKSETIEEARVVVYGREEENALGTGFNIESLAVSLSDDKQSWREIGERKGQAESGETCYTVSIPVGAAARYVRIAAKKPERFQRILLGEVELLDPDDTVSAPSSAIPRPMHVKKTLDKALLDSGVAFLYHCYVTDVLRDADGNPSGVVMANRAGRQAVVAKTIIDATERAVVARLAGAPFRPFPAGVQTFRRVVVGGAERNEAAAGARVIPPAFVGPSPDAGRRRHGVLYIRFPKKNENTNGLYPIVEHTLELPMDDASDRAWAAAEQEARDKTYHPQQQFTSDMLFQIPPDPMRGRQAAEGTWKGVEHLPLGAFRPEGVSRMWVLSGSADVSREHAAKLLRPLPLIDLGQRLGAEAAAEAKGLSAPTGVRLRGKPCQRPAVQGDVREQLIGVRPIQQLTTIPADARALPVLGQYDVVVVGGGTGGAPAGIGAARQGARTLVVEQLCNLGGVGTAGAITSYHNGNRVGFTAEVAGGSSWIVEERMEWWRSTLRAAGADIWFGCIGVGAYVDSGRVRGAVVATPRGRGVVLANIVVDATGNADMAAAAGAATVYVDHAPFGMQGAGLPPRHLGASAANTDYDYTDETDMVDVWHLLVYAKEKFPDAFDLGQLVDTRERRRIVGDFTLTPADIISGRTFPDTISKGLQHGYDTHGYVVDPFLLVRHPLRHSFQPYVPYRCLLPKGVEGLIVAGIALSAHRDAQPFVRMQPEIQNQGYAAGVAAAMASRADASLREIDIRALQQHLVEIGNLPESVLTDEDHFPLPPEQIAAAVSRLEDYRCAAIVFSHREQALPLLREAYHAADGQRKVLYAKMLGTMRDTTGLETLLAILDEAAEWDQVPAYSMGQDHPESGRVGWHMSHLDTTLVAVGRTRSVEALPAVLGKLAMLEPEHASYVGMGPIDIGKASHHLAVYMALEWIGDERAAEPLAKLLQQPGMGGYAITSIEQRAMSDHTRMAAECELALARALLRCGDWQGLGEKTLRAYSQDLRGPFALHAQAVLKQTVPK